VKRLLVGGAILALGIGGMAQSQANSSGDKVTGGGQILVSPDGGAGDTIAFNAQSDGTATSDNPDPAKGQVQYTPHASTSAAKFHGDVTCLVVHSDRSATLAGTIQRGGGDHEFFQLDVVDQNADDASAPEQGSDIVVLSYPADTPDCSDQQATDDGPVLARGNVQVHKTK
jgi:hypothetical protein